MKIRLELRHKIGIATGVVWTLGLAGYAVASGGGHPSGLLLGIGVGLAGTAIGVSVGSKLFKPPGGQS